MSVRNSNRRQLTNRCAALSLQLQRLRSQNTKLVRENNRLRSRHHRTTAIENRMDTMLNEMANLLQPLGTAFVPSAAEDGTRRYDIRAGPHLIGGIVLLPSTEPELPEAVAEPVAPEVAEPVAQETSVPEFKFRRPMPPMRPLNHLPDVVRSIY